MCGRCGYASGEGNRCPHCNAVARVEPKGAGASLTWVCGVCGGPRMPQGVSAPAALEPLREAKASQRLAQRSRAAFWLFVPIALFMVLVLAAAWPAALVGKLILLILAAVPVALAARARGRAGNATAKANEALDRAWLAAAEAVAAGAKSGVTVAELAKRLTIDPTRAEKLLTQLAVHDRTRIDVDDDAEVRYSIATDVDTSKVRVGSSEDQFLALEAAEAEAASAGEGEGGGAARRAATTTPDGERRLTAEQEELEAKKLATSPFGRGSSR